MSSALDAAHVVDLFAGAGGWDQALRRILRFRDLVVGIDNYRDAVETARRAGHHRIEADIRSLRPPRPRPGRKIVGSPPCQGWSKAANAPGAGDKLAVMELIDDYAAGRAAGDRPWLDERSALTAEPMRWIRAMRPEWIVLEQVPDVLTLWEFMAAHLWRMGYSTWTGRLSAERYGVPQTRRRAFLIASTVDDPSAPRPSVAAPVTIREALSLPDDDDRMMRSNYAGTPGPGRHTAADRGRTMRTLDEPSVTITGRPPQWEWHGEATSRVRLTAAECGSLQTFPADYPWQGGKVSAYQQSGNAVPPTLAAEVLRQVVCPSG